MPAIRSFCVSVGILTCALVAPPAWAAICRVTPAGTAFNDGSSWAVPVNLTQALAVPGICTEIWVAQGVYKPAAAGAVTLRFNIASGVEVYGGFAGVEATREQRNPGVNLSVLSGDIDNNDNAVGGVVQEATGIVGENSNTVVKMINVGADTVLDGFTITAGAGSNGGGLFCDGEGTGSQCNPVLSNLVFSGNAALVGGAMYNLGSFGGVASPVMREVRFRGNLANVGGAMANLAVSGASSPSLTRVVFEDNVANDIGGAVVSLAENLGGISQPVLNQVSFIGNHAGFDGGGMANLSQSNADVIPDLSNVAFVENTAGGSGGAVANIASTGRAASAVFRNATFSGNEAEVRGGAIYNSAGNSGGASSPTLTNVTFTANRVGLSGLGGAIFSETSNGGTSAAVLHNVVLWGNLAPLGQGPEIAYNGGTGTFDHSIVKGSGGSAAWNPAFGVNAGSNLDVDPRLGGLDESIGFTPTIGPTTGSPAIDAGSACPAQDQRGVVRPQGAQCDIGAVEFFTIPLISHNGFEDCWSPVLTRSEFLQRIQTAFDGRTVCIPQYTGTILGQQVNACNTAACPGGAVGCPITLDVSPFGDGGNFRLGTFTATGTASDMTIPVSSNFINCTFTATNIQAAYGAEYAFSDDGNGGKYAALLNRITATPTQLSLDSTNATCDGNADNVAPALINQAATAIAAALRAPLEAATLRESMCPLD